MLKKDIKTLCPDLKIANLTNCAYYYRNYQVLDR